MVSHDQDLLSAVADKFYILEKKNFKLLEEDFEDYVESKLEELDYDYDEDD